MRCGKEATDVEEQVFYSRSLSRGNILLGLVVTFLANILGRVGVVGFYNARKMELEVPLCDKHSGDSSRTNYLMYGGLAIFILWGGFVVLAAAMMPDSLDRMRNPEKTYTPHWLFRVSGFSLGLITMIWPIILLRRLWLAIRATEITDEDITLTNVAPEFVVAMERDSRRTAKIEAKKRSPRLKQE
jgi:hypothetical protein